MNKLTFNINNGETLELIQHEHDGKVEVKGILIPADEMVMLVNYYQYIKNNNIKCDFINPQGC